MPCDKVSCSKVALDSEGNKDRGKAYLEGILAGEALGAEGARERLDSQMDALVALEIVVAAERLNTLIALEGSFRLGLGLAVLAIHHVRTVALRNHTRHHGHLTSRLVHI